MRMLYIFKTSKSIFLKTFFFQDCFGDDVHNVFVCVNPDLVYEHLTGCPLGTGSPYNHYPHPHQRLAQTAVTSFLQIAEQCLHQQKNKSYQYRKSRSGDKTTLSSSYLHNWLSYISNTTSLIWISTIPWDVVSYSVAEAWSHGIGWFLLLLWYLIEDACSETTGHLKHKYPYLKFYETLWSTLK